VFVAVETLPTRQQVLVEAFQRFLQHRFRNLEASVARVQQEFGDVWRKLR
jgi:hypothetical protein